MGTLYGDMVPMVTSLISLSFSVWHMVTDMVTWCQYHAFVTMNCVKTGVGL